MITTYQSFILVFSLFQHQTSTKNETNIIRKFCIWLYSCNTIHFSLILSFLKLLWLKSILEHNEAFCIPLINDSIFYLRLRFFMVYSDETTLNECLGEEKFFILVLLNLGRLTFTYLYPLSEYFIYSNIKVDNHIF